MWCIYNEVEETYAVLDVDGWEFSKDKKSACTFTNRDDAMKAIHSTELKYDSHNLLIIPFNDGERNV